MTTKTVRIPSTIPCIPIDKVLLPGLVMQVTVRQKETVTLLEKMYRKEILDRIVVCAPMRATTRPPPEGSETKKIRDAEEEAEDASGVSSFIAGDHAESRRSNEFTNTEDLFEFGCAARVLRLEKKKGTFRLVVEGLLRVRIDHYPQTLPFLLAGITPYPDPPISRDDTELFSLGISLKATAREIMTLLEELQIPHTVISNMKSLIDKTPSGLLADMLVSMVNASYEEKLSILGMVDMKERLTKAIEHLTKQIQILRISQKVHTTVQGNLGKKQREFYLRQQLNAIKAELGEKDSPEDDDEIAELSKRLMEAGLPPEADKVAKRELKRLKKMPQMMAEYQVIRTYLDLLCELPWMKKTETVMDMEHARKQLEDDHYGLDPVKKRIMEFLTVLKLKGNLRGPILCLIGPPGVGKTSLGRSIAAALGRKFHRISLGGVRDEAEIRGHRRTYVGALPGLIIQGIRKCKVKNPVILLDEIDKVGTSNHQGDPSAALLEVLDPEQNSTFADHYLNMPFDLSEILFIATANTSDTIAAPLLDRMEVIGIPGYTFSEKRHIAARHLVPKQAKAHGLEPENVVFSDKVLARIAEGYTREAGVRGLEREIAAVCRIKAVEFADSVEKEKPDAYRKEVGEEDIEPYLGVEKFDDEVRARTSVPGIVTGLAWTSLGSGGILFIEATRMPGRGRLKLTGKLGEVIKESAQIGLSWVTANAYRLGLSDSTSADLLSSQDVHIHMPAGSVPKDGPSAGATIVTALVSLFADTPVPPTVAMTGEITLRGLILPVGGIKEKVIAAHRAGLEKVILPDRCRKDLKEVPEEVRKDLKFVFVKDIWEVLREVFPEEKRWPRSSVANGDDASARFEEDGIRRNAMSCRL